jgi:predicted phosphoribosyltransferase
LAQRLTAYAQWPGVLVLALPRGGVPVAFEVAQALNVPLDVFLVRKLGVPGYEELALGALASGGVRVLNQDVIASLNIPAELIEAVAAREQQELERRERAYRDDRPAPVIQGRVIILIDDGLATGSTMYAAVAALKQKHPAKLIVAVPVAARATCEEFQSVVDEVICVLTPEPFMAVGLWYRDFSQTTDEEVRALLARAAQRSVAATPG